MDNLKLVIFDMDGLMFNTERVYCKAIEEYARKYNIEVDIQPLIEVIGSSLPLDLERMIVNHDMSIDDFREKVIHQSSQDAFDEMVKYGVPIKRGLFRLINKIKEKGIKMCVATSTNIEMSSKLLEAANVMENLEFVVTSKDVVNGKPEPDIFIKACEKAKVKPSEALVLEDSNVGVKAAINAGIRFIMVPDIKGPNEETLANCVKICKDLNEVAEII